MANASQPEFTGRRAVVIDPRDNVATLVDERTDANTLASGERVAEGIPYGHKVARHTIRAGERVVKYGVAIGVASADIAAGEHVHVHNVSERTEHSPGVRGLAA